MSNNWHRIEQDLNSRRQALLAEAKHYRIARQVQPTPVPSSFSLLRRVWLRLKSGSGKPQPYLNQQPA